MKKKNIFGTLSVVVLAATMLISDSASTSVRAEPESPDSTVSTLDAQPVLSPVSIEKIEETTKTASSDFLNGAEIIIPEPEPIVEESSHASSSENSSNASDSGKNDPDLDTKSDSISQSKNDSTKSSDKPDSTNNSGSSLFQDNIAGKLADPNHVPCGGLWEYYYDNFYAREINCGGSDIYLNLMKGDKIKIASKTCTVVGSQQLNYYSDKMEDVAWYGNTIVQTCYHGNRGKVRLVNFNCD